MSWLQPLSSNATAWGSNSGLLCSQFRKLAGPRARFFFFFFFGKSKVLGEASWFAEGHRAGVAERPLIPHEAGVL